MMLSPEHVNHTGLPAPLFPNHPDTPRPTNPGELNFLAKPVRLEWSSSGQTCFLLQSPWLQPPSHPPGQTWHPHPALVRQGESVMCPQTEGTAGFGNGKGSYGGWSWEREESILLYLLQVPASLAPCSTLHPVPAQGMLWSKEAQTGMVFPSLVLQTSPFSPCLG